MNKSLRIVAGLKRQNQGVTKICRLTNCALVYEPKWGEANEYSYAHGAQVNFGDLTPYLTCEQTAWANVGSRSLRC
jgi:hypothetical protein